MTSSCLNSVVFGRCEFRGNDWQNLLRFILHANEHHNVSNSWYHWPFVKRIHRWISLWKGQQCGKRFHVMTSPWSRGLTHSRWVSSVPLYIRQVGFANMINFNLGFLNLFLVAGFVFTCLPRMFLPLNLLLEYWIELVPLVLLCVSYIFNYILRGCSKLCNLLSFRCLVLLINHLPHVC